MMDFGDVILRTLFPSFMAIQACTWFLIFCGWVALLYIVTSWYKGRTLTDDY